MLKPTRNPRRSRRGRGVKRLGALVGLCLMFGAVAFTALRPPLDAAPDADWIDDRAIDEYRERLEQVSGDVAAAVEMVAPGPSIEDLRPPPEPVAVKERRFEIELAARRLRLKSVMEGRHPMAMVNGRIYRLGGVIEVSPRWGDVPFRFQVVSISKDSVTLLFEEPEHNLRVERTLWLTRDSHPVR